MTINGPKVAPGTRVSCTYRTQHVGTVLADDDPRGWTGSLAFYDCVPSPDAVRAWIAEYQRRDVRLAHHDCQRVTIAWDFGKVYTESLIDVFTVEESDQ